jgi:hypothetical protein
VTKKVGTTKARQGETRHIVRYMLGISVAAAIVALAGPDALRWRAAALFG